MAKLPDAARQYGVCTKTLRRRIADGTITGHRLGQRIILVDLDELDARLYRIPSTGDAA
jgi:hypothetical protein